MADVSARRVVLAEPGPHWVEFFKKEQSVLHEILGANLTEAHHIGSTSISGIRAKPTVDIMPVVKSLIGVDERKQEFEKRGYLFRGEYGMAGRRYVVGLQPEGVNHRVHIHIFAEGHHEIARHLAFRDYLRANPATAKAYEALKMELQRKFEADRQKYQDGKSEFCEGLLRKIMGAAYKPPAPWT